MTIYSIYVINRAGSLIYQYDHYTPKSEVEKTFSYPLDIVLKIYDEKVVVAFGQRDGIKVGHAILNINGHIVDGRTFRDKKDEKHDVIEYVTDENNFPLSLKFGRSKLSTNEKIMLAGMFHSLYAISSQLSPLPRSSGIQQLETDIFKLHCMHTLTGIKFLVISDVKRINEDALLRKLYEIYADFALKNPFYSIDMPIRCELFEKNVQEAVKNADTTSSYVS